MKKISFILFLIMLFSSTVNTSAKSVDNNEVNDIITIYINNSQKNVTNLLRGKNIDGRIMIRALGVEWNVGAEVTYDSEKGEICFERVDKKIVMKLDSNVMKVNGSSVIMDCKPILIDEYVYIPLKYLYEALDCEVEWNSELKAVNINTRDIKIGSGMVTVPLNDNNILSGVNVEKTFDSDYIVEYKDILDKMFPLGWTIENEKQYVCEYFRTYKNEPKSIYVFNRWNISYLDKNNNNKIFTMSNNISMSGNIKEYILNFFAECYMENYINEYFDDDVSCDVKFYFAGHYNFWGSEDETKDYERYIDNLVREDGVIDLSNLDMNKIYEICPVYADISIYCNIADIENNNDKQLSIDNSYNTAESMVEKIIVDSNNLANIELQVLYEGDKTFEGQTYKSLYLSGEKYMGNPSVLVHISDLAYEVYKDTLYK